MKKIFALLSFSFFFSFLFSQNTEEFYAVIDADTVTLWHTNATRNCCSVHRVDYEIDGNQINVFEIEIAEYCYCGDCYFDLSVSVFNLIPQTYNVNFYMIDYYNQETFYCGSTSFSMPSGSGNHEKLKDYNSDCLGWVSIYDNEEEIKIYPNPLFSDKILNIENTSQDSEFEIYTTSGILLKKEALTNDFIDLSSFSQGVYVLKVFSDNQVFNYKILVL